MRTPDKLVRLVQVSIFEGAMLCGDFEDKDMYCAYDGGWLMVPSKDLMAARKLVEEKLPTYQPDTGRRKR